MVEVTNDHNIHKSFLYEVCSPKESLDKPAVAHFLNTDLSYLRLVKETKQRLGKKNINKSENTEQDWIFGPSSQHGQN